MVKLYDVAPDGTAVMFDDQTSTVDGSELAFDLKSTDWTLVASGARSVCSAVSSDSCIAEMSASGTPGSTSLRIRSNWSRWPIR